MSAIRSVLTLQLNRTGMLLVALVAVRGRCIPPTTFNEGTEIARWIRLHALRQLDFVLLLKELLRRDLCQRLMM